MPEVKLGFNEQRERNKEGVNEDVKKTVMRRDIVSVMKVWTKRDY